MSFNPLLLTDKDIIRDLLGDTDSASELRTDAYIDANITRLGSMEAALVWTARSLIAEISQQPVKIRLSDGLSVDYSARIPGWQSIVIQYGSAVQSGSYGFSFDSRRIDGYSIDLDELA